ncbi:MAG TPA: hypothetical protein VK680_02320 [Solirubrobacteraceae bacterium]|nr:hypothetical protein [Solirubrobacteraceae bacterium]
MRYLLQVIVAGFLAAAAIGLAHPAQQTCAEARAIKAKAGSNAALATQAESRLEALLKNGAPACAIEELAGSGAGAVRSHHGVPAQLSGLSALRAWITDRGLGTTELVLLLVSALLLLRTALAMVISRRPGSVSLDTVTNAATEKPDAAIAAQLRQRLADQHLLAATLIPGGGLPQAVATTLKETELPNTGWVASLVRALPSLLPKAGMEVDAVIREPQKEGDQSACTATLTDLASGRVTAMLTERGATPLAAADAVAASTIAHILDSPALRRRTPAWSRFGIRSTTALAELTHGDDLLTAPPSDATTKDQALKKALSCYINALDSDPANLTVALKLGNTQELLADADQADQGRHLVAAATTYLRAQQLWPTALSPRFRAAVALTACADSFATCEGELESLGLTSQKACLKAAISLLNGLVDDLRWRTVTLRWLRTFYRSRERDAGTRKYFQRFVNPFSVTRRRVRTAYKMSVLIASESDEREPDVREKEVKRLLCETFPQSYTLFKRLAVDSHVRYNAACYYARRANVEADADKKGVCLQKANELLADVLSDPNHEVTGKWLFADPDLASIRDWKTAPWHRINVLGGLDTHTDQAAT